MWIKLVFLIAISFKGKAMTHARVQESVSEPGINIDIPSLRTLH